jgi:hypothetical protein
VIPTDTLSVVWGCRDQTIAPIATTSYTERSSYLDPLSTCAEPRAPGTRACLPPWDLVAVHPQGRHHLHPLRHRQDHQVCPHTHTHTHTHARARTHTYTQTHTHTHTHTFTTTVNHGHRHRPCLFCSSDSQKVPNSIHLFDPNPLPQSITRATRTTIATQRLPWRVIEGLRRSVPNDPTTRLRRLCQRMSKAVLTNDLTCKR